MKILKQKRGISTIIAVLLMIVISVAAAVITYIWVMGYLGGTMAGIKGKTEQGTITIESVSNASTTVSVVVRNVGSIKVTADKVYVDGADASATGTGEISVGGTKTLTFTKSLSKGTVYAIKVVCTDGASATTSWTC